jgi:hypothetical protein
VVPVDVQEETFVTRGGGLPSGKASVTDGETFLDRRN